MDFGRILDKWEKEAPRNGVFDKDTIDGGNSKDPVLDGEKRKNRRSRLLSKKPDAYIDLHGLTKDEAWQSLEIFFENSRHRGFEKVKIIHGKGSHNNSLNEAVLRDLSRSFIEKCSFAGESGYCSAREGGSGATWVIFKEN